MSALPLEQAVTALEAGADLVSAGGETGARNLPPAALSARLSEAAAVLESRERVDVLPLLHELWVTSQGLSARGAGRDARAAIAAGIDALLERLGGGDETHWHANQLAAIVNLRSVGGRALRSEGCGAPGGAGLQSSGSVPAAVAVRLLPAFRTGLVGLLKEAFDDAAALLAGTCREAGAGAADEGQARCWRQAAEMFDMSLRPAGVGLRVAVGRMAMGLESLLRRLSAGERDVDGAAEIRLWDDIEVLHSLMVRIDSPVTVCPETAAGGNDEVGRAVEAITGGADIADRLSVLCDVFLYAGRYRHWFQVWKLAQDDVGRDAVLRRLAGWHTVWGTAGDTSASAVVHAHPARDRIAARRSEPGAPAAEPAVESAPVVRAGVPADLPEVVPVDEALLENLNFAVAEMRGAHSRAEANLGSLRGGLQDMERTLRLLRAQIEALELDPGDGGETATSEPEARSRNMPPGLGMLSRGIDELQRIQDALHALTEETESVLASQASERSELEQGLLKTRLVPVSTQFERWTETVRGVSTARLDVDGDDVLLERGASIALSNALIPLLEACAVKAGAGPIAMGISRPKFDLLMQIRFEGGAVAPELWRGLAAAFEPMGAVALQRHEASTTTCRIVMPGPPQSLDVLMVELGGRLFALPVDGVAAVARRPQALAAEDDGAETFVTDSRSLAALLGVPENPESATSGLDTYLLLAAGSRRRIACLVDTVRGRERVLARSPGPLLANNPWILAVVVNEHAPPTLVLDLSALAPALIGADVAV